MASKEPPDSTAPRRFTGYPPNYGFPKSAFDKENPLLTEDFCDPSHMEAFEAALNAPDTIVQSPLLSPSETAPGSPAVLRKSTTGESPATMTPLGADRSMFFTARNDWTPVNEKVRRTTASGRKTRKEKKPLLQGRRRTDETREGIFYSLLKWPLFVGVFSVLAFEWLAYLLTRFYIWVYEHFFSWRGTRNMLRTRLRESTTYDEWVEGAQALDDFLGRESWKEDDNFAYYDSGTVRRALSQLRKARAKAEQAEARGEPDSFVAGELVSLLQTCVKNNFAGVENTKLYSQTYYGTKHLVQEFTDEVTRCLDWAAKSPALPEDRRHVLYKHLSTNYGRTALCLSGGATLAFYHFGVVRALLDADLLPNIITGTSGGAMVAALVATRTNEELRQLIVPALASKITACNEPFTTWLPRWWKTGARFDSVDWATKSQWWTRGSTTFREAYERTGRVLNITCVPADPHSPTILCNHLTSPDCVIWSAMLASAAVPGILNPVVLMMKLPDGKLAPYSFGHRWKDGSLRTDIPLRALDLHFNVNYTIVSQTNPHINLFFFHSRGTVGHPVTHRKGKGWRGGYIGSAVENFLRLDMIKWLRFIRSTELLPRPLGQDWSQLWLQPFAGTITIWPKSRFIDLVRILTDPDEWILARMIHEGRQSAFPTVRFVGNRLAVERKVAEGRMATRGGRMVSVGGDGDLMSEDELKSVLKSLEDENKEESSEGSVSLSGSNSGEESDGEK